MWTNRHPHFVACQARNLGYNSRQIEGAMVSQQPTPGSAKTAKELGIACGCEVHPAGNGYVIEFCPRHAAAPELLKACKEIDRIYSTIGGIVDPGHYGLIANSPDCGKAIGRLRD